MRTALTLCVLLALACPTPAQWRDDIARLGVSDDMEAFSRLMQAPPALDPLLVEELRKYLEPAAPAEPARLRRIVQALGARRSAQRDADFEGAAVVMRLMARYPIWADEYLQGRGPEFYHFLIASAKGEDPDLRKTALRLLETTAAAARARPGSGDPALIRLFRSEGNLRALGLLRDRESLEAMREAIRSGDRSVSVQGMEAAALVPDPEASLLLIPLLSHPDEVRAGEAPGKFGPAYWALRRTAQPRHAPVLRRLAQAHEGIPRAYSLNLIGYLGSPPDIPFLEEFLDDPLPRTRAAASNAIERIKGGLPRQTDAWIRR
jgi:HEAT repeat protein